MSREQFINSVKPIELTYTQWARVLTERERRATRKRQAKRLALILGLCVLLWFGTFALITFF